MADRGRHVYMDGVRAGTVTMTGSGGLSFAYDERYRTTPGATPLSLSMPKAVARHRQRAVLPFLQGLLPDNDQALGAIAATYQVSPRSPFALPRPGGLGVRPAWWQGCLLECPLPSRETPTQPPPRAADGLATRARRVARQSRRTGPGSGGPRTGCAVTASHGPLLRFDHQRGGVAHRTLAVDRREDRTAIVRCWLELDKIT